MRADERWQYRVTWLTDVAERVEVSSTLKADGFETALDAALAKVPEGVVVTSCSIEWAYA